MKVVGTDREGRLVRLPGTLDEYFRGAAKRFSHIVKMDIEYEEWEEVVSVTGGVAAGDFSLARAYLADHENSLMIRFICPFAASEEAKELELFFPTYFYGFIEDTFARAIHHKIEGAGFACRECVGKKELRLREYDRQFRLVSDDDAKAGIRMAFSRLLFPTALSEVHKEQYEAFIKVDNALVLRLLAELPGEEARLPLEYLTRTGLLSFEAVDEILPELSEGRHAPMVAALLGYQNKRRKRTWLSI